MNASRKKSILLTTIVIFILLSIGTIFVKWAVDSCNLNPYNKVFTRGFASLALCKEINKSYQDSLRLKGKLSDTPTNDEQWKYASEIITYPYLLLSHIPHNKIIFTVLVVGLLIASFLFSIVFDIIFYAISSPPRLSKQSKYFYRRRKTAQYKIMGAFTSDGKDWKSPE